MSIVFNAVTNQGNGAGTTTDATFSHTATGANLIAIAGVQTRTSQDLAVTYGGIAMTKLSTNTIGPSTNEAETGIEWHYLTGINEGASTFSAKMASAASYYAYVATYTGVDRNYPIGTVVTSSNVASTTVAAVVTSAVNELVIDFFATPSSAPHTPVPARTERVSLENLTLDGGTGGFAASEETGAASVSMGWQWDDSGFAAAGLVVAVNLKPALSGKARAVKYFHDINDPGGRIYDDLGRVVQPWELKPNNWIRVTGLFLPSSTKYASFTQDPQLAYIEEVTFSIRGGLRIKTNRGEMTEVLLARAAGGVTL